MVTFPERRFPGGHFPGWDNFLWLIYRRTLNNRLNKFIPRRKANWLALLTPQGYAKCQMLIFHHNSKTNELRNVHNNQTYEKHKGRSLTRLSIRQLQAGLMSQSWNELLRHWRSGLFTASVVNIHCRKQNRPTGRLLFVMMVQHVYNSVFWHGHDGFCENLLF